MKISLRAYALVFLILQYFKPFETFDPKLRGILAGLNDKIETNSNRANKADKYGYNNYYQSNTDNYQSSDPCRNNYCDPIFEKCVRDHYRQGYRCMSKPNPCDSNPCSFKIGKPRCIRTTSIEGYVCVAYPDPCSQFPCDPITQECESDLREKHGFRCISKKNPCLSSPCKIAGKTRCIRTGNEYGYICAPNIDPCYEKPCNQIKEECEIFLNETIGFKCIPKPDPCENNPCQDNEMTPRCIRTINGYECVSNSTTCKLYTDPCYQVTCDPFYTCATNPTNSDQHLCLDACYTRPCANNIERPICKLKPTSPGYECIPSHDLCSSDSCSENQVCIIKSTNPPTIDCIDDCECNSGKICVLGNQCFSSTSPCDDDPDPCANNRVRKTCVPNSSDNSKYECSASQNSQN